MSIEFHLAKDMTSTHSFPKAMKLEMRKKIRKVSQLIRRVLERRLREAVRLARARLAERTEAKPSAIRRNPR